MNWPDIQDLRTLIQKGPAGEAILVDLFSRAKQAVAQQQLDQACIRRLRSRLARMQAKLNVEKALRSRVVDNSP